MTIAYMFTYSSKKGAVVRQVVERTPNGLVIKGPIETVDGEVIHPKISILVNGETLKKNDNDHNREETFN